MQTDTRADNRSYRLLDLYKRLQQGEALSKRELADRYGVSEKTVQRDIEGLREYLAGEQSYLEVVYDKGRAAIASLVRAPRDCSRRKCLRSARFFWRAARFPRR